MAWQDREGGGQGGREVTVQGLGALKVSRSIGGERDGGGGGEAREARGGGREEEE